MTRETYSISSIGRIDPGDGGFTLTLDAPYRDGLAGLSDFSHAFVLWWAHEADSAEDRARLVEPRPYSGSSGDVGIFGSRAPSRVNPIGLSLIYLADVDIETGVIHTPYIDTEPGTPVIDIKPYFQASDRVNDVRMPDWAADWPDSVEASARFDWAAAFK